MRSIAVAAAVVLASSSLVAGCNDAITLEIASDRPVPQAIDAICVAIADASPRGGHYGHVYPLTGEYASLPQTLRVEPGRASSALAWVRADRGGVPVATSSASVDFNGDVTLSIPRCVVGPAGAPSVRATMGPMSPARLVASQGQGGTLVVALTPGAAVAIDAKGTALTATDLPAPPPGTPIAVLATDVDGDCDDDLVIATDGAAPLVWVRDGLTFTPGAQVGAATVSAVAAVDIEHDGDLDLITGAGASLVAYLNDGAGSFTAAPAALSGEGRVSMVSALATGDLDGDGNADLVVGQAGPPLAAWLGRGGRFDASDAVVPAIPLDVERLTLTDADGDFDPDLGVAVRGAGMRLLVDRDGRLEDQSFVRLPQPAPIAHTISFGGWDAGCEPDAIVASSSAASALRGEPGGAFAAEDAAVPAATDAVLVDIDDDGDLDALLSTAEGVTWLAR